MLVLRFSACYALLLIWLTGVLSKLQLPRPTMNLTIPSTRTYQLVAVDWRSKAFGRHSTFHNSTLSRRECWIMKMGQEDNYREDEVICTDKKAPTLAQLIAHGRNGTEYGKADAAHIPVFYTDWKNPVLGAAGGLAGTNPSEKILWYIDRSFKGYQSDKSGCQGGLVLNKKVYTYADMVRDSWFISQMAELRDHPEDYPEYVYPEYGFSPLMTLTWCYCQALARAAMPASGEAWLAMPWDTADWQWLPESNWNLNELPALTQNPTIQKIWRFDPHWYFYNPEKVWPADRPKIEASLPRILWDRALHGEFNQDWLCPLL